MRMTIQDVINIITATVPEAPLEDILGATRDTIKVGDASQTVKGIVTTFLATSEVIEKAVELGANLVITHEPTFYEDKDETDWLEDDPVYQAKRRLIDENNVVIWRFHDYWHLHRPDGILTGVLQELGWDNQNEAEIRAHLNTRVESVEDYIGMARDFTRFNIQPISLLDLAEMFKEKLDIERVRMVGNPAMICSRIALLVGMAGGKFPIEMVGRDDIDVLVCGEINEWETSEYVRDALHFYQEKGLLILGHVNSEESGMKWCADWLRPLLPGMEITHVSAGDPFHFV